MNYTDTLRAYIPSAAQRAIRDRLVDVVKRYPGDIYAIYRDTVQVEGTRNWNGSGHPGASYAVRFRLMHPNAHAVDKVTGRIVLVGCDIWHHHPWGNRPRAWPCYPACAACRRRNAS